MELIGTGSVFFKKKKKKEAGKGAKQVGAMNSGFRVDGSGSRASVES